jgi:bacterioferritin
MYFHFHLDDQGFRPLASLFKRISIEEMGHIELLADRILFLKGDVDMEPAGPVQKIHDPEKMVTIVAGMEEGAIELYNRSAAESSRNADAATRQLFERLILDEERHFGEFDTQLDNIKRFGPSYLALQSFGGGAEPGGGEGE